MVTENKMVELEKIVTNIVARNDLRFMRHIQGLAQKHFDIPNYPTEGQVRYTMKKAGIKKGKNGFFVIVEEDVFTPVSRICMRCDTNKILKSFPKVYGHSVNNGYLLICRDCIYEESKFTFEKTAEIRGVYAYMEVMYQNVIDKEMYNRFWEKAYSAV